jgi:tetracycline repressor-like protein
MLQLHRHQPTLHRVLFEEAPQPPQIHERVEAIFNAAVEAITNYFATQPQVTVRDPRLAELQPVTRPHRTQRYKRICPVIASPVRAQHLLNTP